MNEIEDLIRKAKRYLRTADLSLKDGNYDSSVSRCYYAMFFMVEALLLTKELNASSQMIYIYFKRRKTFARH